MESRVFGASEMQAQALRNIITLKGSTEIVSEFFGFSINSILYQRGIYDPDSFISVSKYGLKMLMTTDQALQTYLKRVLSQLSHWLQQGSVKQLVLVVSAVDTNEVLERWVFNVQTDSEAVQNGKTYEKSEKAITGEIAAIIRQITSSVSFLPLLETPCTFDLLVYTSQDLLTPESWEESDPRYIAQSNEVRLRSFTTKIHKVQTSVTYKAL